jgi:hypothetical protein
MPLTEETNEDATCRTTTLVAEARIWSPLLLKTNLPRPAAAWGSRRTNLLQYSGQPNYKATRVSASGGYAWRYLRAMTLACLHEYRAVGPPEAVRAAHRAQKHQRQQIFFAKVPRTRTVPIKTAAILTLEQLG